MAGLRPVADGRCVLCSTFRYYKIHEISDWLRTLTSYSRGERKTKRNRLAVGESRGLGDRSGGGFSDRDLGFCRADELRMAGGTTR